MGAGVLVIALFGLAKQLGWESELTFFDGIICAFGVAGILGGLLESKIIGALASAGVMVGVIAYRHDLFQVDFGILFFGMLIVIGAGMVFNGIGGNSD
jgi:hypothetical protein